MRRATRVMRWGFTLREVLVTAAVLSVLMAVLMPALARARDEVKEETCRTNLRSLGQGLHIYSNDHNEWFPHHYYEADEWSDGQPPNHGVDWIGSMGSNEWLSITENSTKSPRRNHPSRSLFMLMGVYGATPSMFICPESGDKEDPLENYGTDSAERKHPEHASPGKNRFDFQGYKSLSYGYQLPYGPRSRPNASRLDIRMALVADKGPYYTAGKLGKGGTHTVSDQRSHPAAAALDQGGRGRHRRQEDARMEQVQQRQPRRCRTKRALRRWTCQVRRKPARRSQ